jgi:hypothetical protein
MLIEDFGLYADTAAMLAVWSVDDPEGMAIVDLTTDAFDTSSGKCLRQRFIGLTPSFYPYPVTISRQVSGLTPGAVYQFTPRSAGISKVWSNIPYIPAFNNFSQTVTADGSGNATIFLAPGIASGSPTSTGYFDGLDLSEVVNVLPPCTDGTRSWIGWIDADGPACLANGFPQPGDRFAAWVPLTSTEGPEAEALGTGECFKFPFRDDYGAQFELRYIPQDLVRTALRCIRHLNSGGIVTLSTGDADARTYQCKKWRGSEPSLSGPDPKDLRRTLKLTLKNLAKADMLVIWP